VAVVASDEGARGGLRERKRQSTRRRIEREALALFDANGFDETTVDHIAAAAEVSRASVFRYFGSKDDIVFAPEVDLIGVITGLVRQEPPLGLDEVILRYAQHVDADVPDLHARAQVIARTPKLVERFGHVRARWEHVVADELARRRGGPSTRTFEDRVVAATATSTLFVAILAWAMDGGSRADFVRRGLRRAARVRPPVTPRRPPAKSGCGWC
jgi:AcrR family transcriptional regulator